MEFRNYGTRHRHDFPNPDDIIKILNNGEIAYVKEIGTEYDYILTKQLSCWTRVDIINSIGDYTQNMKKCELYDDNPMTYVRVALAIETLAYHNKNYLWSGDNNKISEEVQTLLIEALKQSDK